MTQSLKEMYPRSEYRFPDGFEWGVATSAYQIEGASNIDGKGPSIWDRFCEKPGNIRGATSGKFSCDHYNRYREDVALMKRLGVSTYRFSLSWPRVFPSGEGLVNEKGADFYDRLIDELLGAGIQPAVTLFHWDLPQAMEDRFGGWTSRETAKRLGDFASWAGERFGKRVRRYFTVNEIFCFTERCYGMGEFAPGRVENNRVRNQVRHNGLLAHGYALAGLRASAPHAEVGLAENIVSYVPAIETDSHINAARKAFFEGNDCYATAIFEGGYPDCYLSKEGKDAPKVEEGDFDLISAPIDVLGLNIYTGKFVIAADSESGYEVVDWPTSYPSMYADWMKFVPTANYWTPRFIEELWGKRAMYLTENGCGCDDRINENGQVLDLDRITYLREYLKNLHRAIEEGYSVEGYYQWSLMDNFEWTDGYAVRFGITHVDFETLKRTPKMSYQFYSEVIKNNAVR